MNRKPEDVLLLSFILWHLPSFITGNGIYIDATYINIVLSILCPIWAICYLSSSCRRHKWWRRLLYLTTGVFFLYFWCIYHSQFVEVDRALTIAYSILWFVVMFMVLMWLCCLNEWYTSTSVVDKRLRRSK